MRVGLEERCCLSITVLEHLGISCLRWNNDIWEVPMLWWAWGEGQELLAAASPACCPSPSNKCPEWARRGRGSQAAPNCLEFKGSGVKSEQLACRFAYPPPRARRVHPNTPCRAYGGFDLLLLGLIVFLRIISFRKSLRRSLLQTFLCSLCLLCRKAMKAQASCPQPRLWRVDRCQRRGSWQHQQSHSLLVHLDEKSSPVTIAETETSTRKIEKETKVSFLDIWRVPWGSGKVGNLRPRVFDSGRSLDRSPHILPLWLSSLFLFIFFLSTFSSCCQDLRNGSFTVPDKTCWSFLLVIFLSSLVSGCGCSSSGCLKHFLMLPIRSYGKEKDQPSASLPCYAIVFSG